MPDRTSISPEFQALILCGPGLSLNTFTSTPDEFPKALVPIANRPMVWYPLDWCYRMNVSSKFDYYHSSFGCWLPFPVTVVVEAISISRTKPLRT